MSSPQNALDDVKEQKEPNIIQVLPHEQEGNKRLK